MKNEKLLDKIAKLLRLSESPNQHEAELAAQRAQELMTRHSITEAMLEDAGGVPEVSITESEAIEASAGGVVVWKRTLLASIAGANGCTAVRSRKACSRWSSVRLVGAAQDVEQAAALYRHLRDYATTCWAEYRRSRNSSGGESSYYFGFVASVTERIKEGRATARMAAQEGASDAAALVVVNRALARIDGRKSKLAEWLAEQGIKKSQKPALKVGDNDAYYAGANAGRSAGLTPTKGLLS